MRHLFWATLLLTPIGSSELAAQQRARVELPHESGWVVIEAGSILRESAQEWRAEGEVVISFGDSLLKSEQLTYNQDTGMVVSPGELTLSRGVQYLKGSSGQFNLKDGTGVLNDADGFTDEKLFVRAKRLLKTGPDTYVAERGHLTACQEVVPKWRLETAKAKIRVNSWASLRHVVLRIKKVPVFYFPYLTFPTAKRERSSGFVIPSTGNSSNKGKRFTQAFYLVLGRSADLQVRADYFSERGLGHGLNLRVRPDNYSYLNLDAFTLNDRLGQGGTSFIGSGRTRWRGYRLVANFNLVSNFTFRRVFADSFYAATSPTEESRLFVTHNTGNRSVNFRLSRQETIFRRKNAITRHAPTFSFAMRGQRLGKTPFYFDLHSEAGGLRRSDSQIESPPISQRLDFQPSLYLSLPLFQGLRITPQISLRETFYSDRVVEDEAGNRRVESDNLVRQYLDFSIDLKGWGLSKVYRQGQPKAIKHLIEPHLRYRFITGIDQFDNTLRFDAEDTIANTNEIEFGLVSRLFVKRATREGSSVHELLSVKVGQKYFFDPDFGGAFDEGSINQFFPLYTLTGFHYGSIRRRFSPLTTLARINPGRRVSLDLRGDFDSRFERFRNLSLTGFWNRNLLRLGTTYFLTQELEPGTIAKNQFQGQIRYGRLNRGFSFSAIFSYDARARALLNSRSRANYFWDCCGVSAEYQRLNVGLRRESQIRFSFFLKGLGSFGTIRRPHSIF